MTKCIGAFDSANTGLPWIYLPWVRVKNIRMSRGVDSMNAARKKPKRIDAKISPAAPRNVFPRYFQARNAHFVKVFLQLTNSSACRHSTQSSISIVSNRRKTRRVICESFFGKNLNRPIRNRKVWRTISMHLNARNIFQQMLGSPQVFAKLFWSDVVKQLVSVTVTGKFVACRNNIANKLRMAFCDPA